MKELILLKAMPDLIDYICKEGDCCYIHGFFLKRQITYSHAHKLCRALEKAKLVKLKKEGRTNFIYPYKKLYKINDTIKELERLLK